VTAALGAWVLASRPKTLPAAAAPVVVGAAAAHAAGGFRAGPVLGALLGALLLQIGTNFANDWMDFERGADSADRIGPTRVVQAGLLSAAAVRRGTFAAFGAAALVGVYLTWAAGWPVVVIGVASVLAGLAYTGGPFPLGYHGLGDLFVMIFFGFVAVCGTAWVSALEVPPAAWYGGLAVGSLSTALLCVNNLRDVETDRRAGKRTLPVLLGRRGGELEYVLLLGAAYLAPALLYRLEHHSAWCLLPLMTLPEAFRLVHRMSRRPNAEGMIRLLEATARLLLMFGALFAAGLVAGAR
jgi:1,4-dihydroxy-2-naphthoate octaprenyltransferase